MDTAERAIAIVGAGAILPDAPSVMAFWENVKQGRYSITEVPPERWDPALYYDPDPKAPDKTYSKIGSWVRQYEWDPMKWHMPVPPRVAAAMDEAQQWAIACTRAALDDYGYPTRPLDAERTAVIVGSAIAGEKQYMTVLRLYFPEYERELAESASFAALPAAVRDQISRELHQRVGHRFPEITEDTMPGELANCIAGRIANLFNFRGPNYVCDAACASAMAAITSAADGLVEHDFDVVITGGVDRNMGPSSFIKFCKIGALSATGTRPYAEGADGFVMGEGAAMFVMKRLADAERGGDSIYAVLRGMGASSDGRGKGITAPNPIGQKLAIERAWENAGVSPATVSMIEGHGTSTAVGDVVEVQSMIDVLSEFNLPRGSIALGSVKSNIGHLKGAAGAAGFLKTILALRDKVLPPSIKCEHLNPGIDFAHSPLYVNTELKPWDMPSSAVRRAGASAFGFGGTNFHAVLEEYIPHAITGNGKRKIAVSTELSSRPPRFDAKGSGDSSQPPSAPKKPLRGALVMGADSEAALVGRLRVLQREAQAGRAPAPAAPAESDLRAPERVAIDYAKADELTEKLGLAIQALQANNTAMWKALRAKGVFRGRGPAPKVAFLYTGQGSQYINMLQPLRAVEPIVAETFAEADRVMAPLLGKPLTEFIFVDKSDNGIVAQAEEALRQTAITQPAVLSTDIALTRLLAAYGIVPDMTIGHSLGEYGALVAAGALPFGEALEAVSARGREMTRVSVEDKGRMAAVFAPLEEIERVLKSVDGYVVVANINSRGQAVIGGATKAVEEAMQVFQKSGYHVAALPVSHAFHTKIVAAASDALRQLLMRLHLQTPRVPVVANVSGDFYPMGADAVPQIVDILAQQVSSPVQFVKGLHTLYEAGARVFVESGPKRALQGLVDDEFADRADVLTLSTNHPKNDIAAFNQALCGLYASGLGRGVPASAERPAVIATKAEPPREVLATTSAGSAVPTQDQYAALGRLLIETLERGSEILHRDGGVPMAKPVVITGAALGLPGTEHIFDDANLGRILHGDQFISAIPMRFREAMLDKNITRLVKSDTGEPTFASIRDLEEVIKLAGRGGTFDLEKEYGVPGERIAALDRVTSLAIAAGMDALRDAGIPLVMRYKTTSKGTRLPDRWMLPESMRDDTGIVFASAFPGYNAFADEMSRYFSDHSRRELLAVLQSWRARLVGTHGPATLVREVDDRITQLRAVLEKEPYAFDRRFLFRILSMGHSQFAEYIGARGPNTQVNAACASTTQALGVAEDWIRTGRCRRVIVTAADDVTSDQMMEWIGAGFLATGAAATDDSVEDAAIPFDRRRHGMIVGMGAAAFVIESTEAAAERGVRPICEMLGATTANSAFHGTRLDVHHISQVMEHLVSSVEKRCGISRHQIAPHTVFISHETYTPARGGSAAAEINALRHVFGETADRIIITNTKGFTGHAMGAGIEDVLAVKTLETGCVPPVPNFKEVDPELGSLNLSQGGAYPVEYALRLAAGFGSQISMALLRWTKPKDGVHRSADVLGYAYRIEDQAAWNTWLSRIAGHEAAQLEVVQRTLRLPDMKTKARVAETVAPAEAVVPPIEMPSPAPVKTKAPAAPEPKAVPEQMPAIEPTAKPAPVALSVQAAPSPTGEDDVKARVLALVSEKTGYPVDMLDLDLDLEADLGVDTVKQAEIFAAVREKYGIPRDDQLKLRDFPTLAHVIRFVCERRPKAKVAAESHAAATIPVPLAAPVPARPRGDIKLAGEKPSTTPASPPGESVEERILALVSDKTGYPKEMLDLDLDLEADLGIDTVKQAELFAAIRQTYDIPRDETLKLRDFPTLAHVIRFVYDKRPDLAAPSASTAPAQPKPAMEPVAPPAVAAAPPSPTTDLNVEDTVLAIVAEKTGYPKEMLDLDLDLEADLGIDTVKQAEMFAAVRAAFNIPRDENLKLRDFPTLAHVIRFARERRAAPVTAVAPALKSATPPEQTAVAVEPSRTVASFEATNQIPRRVPVPVLRPPLGMCKPTGAMLSCGARVIIMPDDHGVANALAARLQTRGVEVLRIDGAPDAATLVTRLQQWMARCAIHGVYWLPALNNEEDHRHLTPAGWREAIRVRVKLLYTAMRTLYEQVAAIGTFLVTATCLGGQHGYDEHGAVAPLGGAVVGFAKTYKRERPDCLVKAIDFAASDSPDEVADALIEETLRDPGAVEIGHLNGLRWTIGLQEQPAADGQPGMALDNASVFLVTGAAGSIVSAITADLAAASGGTFYLLDVVPEPDANDPDLSRFATDKEGLKRDLFARIQARGERATPALVEKQLSALERAQAALRAIQAVRAAGGTPFYFSVNLTDMDAVARVIEKVRQQSGRIDVLLHAAGMERSHFLPDKEPGEFDLVFDVKVDGWFNLLHAIGDMPLGATVAFSSIAGRFGNGGQTDYASANDLLCKIASNFRTTRPATRAIAIDWTAWGGIGMATRGSIPKIMEAAGIDMLPPEAGVPLIRRELTLGSTRGEIVVGQRLGVMLGECDRTGGIDATAATASQRGPMVDKLATIGVHRPLVVETTLDPKAQAFLYDHQIDGTPVLPGVMGIEAFAEAAACLLPGWNIRAIEDVSFLAPFKFYRHEQRTVITEVVSHPSARGSVLADCRLIGRRLLPNQAEPQEIVHFTGRVRMVKSLPSPAVVEAPDPSGWSVVEARDIYRLYFHGPAYQVIERAWWDRTSIVGELAKALPNHHQPPDRPLLMAPRIIELCFQTAGLWEMAVQQRMGLPQHVGRVSLLQPLERAVGPLYAVVTPDPVQGNFEARVVDGDGNEFLELMDYRTVALPNAVNPELVRPLQVIMTETCDVLTV